LSAWLDVEAAQAPRTIAMIDVCRLIAMFCTVRANWRDRQIARCRFKQSNRRKLSAVIRFALMRPLERSLTSKRVAGMMM